MAFANGVSRVWVGLEAMISTPAVSGIIRFREKGIAFGGFILTASHNPGGPKEDFGIKYNCENGGPAPEALTDAIYKNTTKISQYKICQAIPDVNLSVVGRTEFEGCVVEVVDSVQDYVTMMKEIFDFVSIKELVQRPDFRMAYDAMHGVAGPYARRIFLEELGANPQFLFKIDPREDFGGGHPDPNLTYAPDLVKLMGLTKEGTVLEDVDPVEIPDFGAAADGDADRNMILGKQFFVTPSDSLAVIAAYAGQCIPFFQKQGGVRAVARSMPTSSAADVVVAAKHMKFFETPTGWKFFGNVMDSKDIFHKEDFNPMICGEESFGTGSNHVREKDGIWAVLAWLQILAFRNKKGQPLVSVGDVVREHWKLYGRNYYCRYDYENVESEKAEAMTKALTNMCGLNKPDIKFGTVPLKKVDEFEYNDPIDGSVSLHQGWRFLFEDGSRFVFRLSGTGSVGATIRLYLEKYEKDPAKLDMSRDQALGPLVSLALSVSQIEQFTGRKAPTVIT